MKFKLIFLLSVITLFFMLFGKQVEAVNSRNTQIINERTEITNLRGGLTEAKTYGTEIFRKERGEWYDFISYADITSTNGVINISYLDQHSMLLVPYVVDGRNKISYNDLSQGTRDQVNMRERKSKERSDFKFAYNFTRTLTISEVGWDIRTFGNVQFRDNKTIFDDKLLIDFNDLVDLNYTLYMDNTSIRVMNLREGFNDLDPIIRFNSSSKDGEVNNGGGAVSGGVTGRSGWQDVIGFGITWRTAHSFDTSFINNSATIRKGVYNFTINNLVVAGGGCSAPDWDFFTGTRRNAIGVSLDGSDYTRLATRHYDFNVTALNSYEIEIEKDFINPQGDTDINLGHIFIGDAGCDQYANVIMSEHATHEYKPHLTITYVEPQDICSGTSPPEVNDWIINDTTICNDGHFEVVKNITIQDGGVLELRNTTMRLNMTSVMTTGIMIANGGKLEVKDLDHSSSTMDDASNITRNFQIITTLNDIFIDAYTGSEFIVNHSILEFMTQNVLASKQVTLYTPSQLEGNIFTHVTFKLTEGSMGTNFTDNNFHTDRQSIQTESNATTNYVHNITFRNNNFTAHSGVQAQVFLNNIFNNDWKFYDNVFETRGFLFALDHVRINKRTQNTYFINNTFLNRGNSPFAGTFHAINDFSGANDNNITLIDNNFWHQGASKIFYFRTNMNFTILAINNTFDYSKLFNSGLIDGGLLIQYYTDVNVTYANMSTAPGTNITLWNATGNEFISVLSGSYITRINTTEQFLNGINYTSYYSNYTIAVNSSDALFGNNMTTFNITKETPSALTTPYVIVDLFLNLLTSCAYAGGDWNIDCSESCEITDDTDLADNIIRFNNVGNIIIASALSRVAGIEFNNACYVDLTAGSIHK